MDGDRTTSEPPTSRLIVTSEDLDRISAAIREGLGKGPPDGKKLARDVLALIAGIAVLSLIYLLLTHWRPTVDLSVRSNALPTTAVLDYEPREGDVVWQFESGQVRALTVEELPAVGADPFLISLPIESTDCAEVASQIDATCVGSVIEVQAPVTVSWSVPQVLQLVSATSRSQAVKLTLRPSESAAPMTAEATGETVEASEIAAVAPPLPRLTIANRHVASPQWCFTYQASAAATLSISGGSDGYHQTFEPAAAPERNCDALRLRVMPGAQATTESDGSPSDSESANSDATPTPRDEGRRASIVTLSGISSLGVTTHSRHLDATALTGTLTLEQSDVRVFDTATNMLITAGGPIKSRLEIQAGSPSLTITGADATGVETDRGNLVRTVWQRNPELILPIFLGLVGVLTPVLAAAYRNGVDYLAARRLRTRPGAK